MYRGLEQVRRGTKSTLDARLRARITPVQLVGSQETLLNTTEAAALTGRSMAAVRNAIMRGLLPVVDRTSLGRPLVRQSDVMVWDKRSIRPRRKDTKPWLRVADALGVLGFASAEELATCLGIHPGNVRKYLLILEAQQQAKRGNDGQWSLTLPSSATGAA